MACPMEQGPMEQGAGAGAVGPRSVLAVEES